MCIRDSANGDAPQYFSPRADKNSGFHDGMAVPFFLARAAQRDFMQDLSLIHIYALVDNSDKPEPIFVSWESLEARKKELEELVNVKIPENLHNKKISRAEGDLRENGGYQDAKEVEKVLNRRRAELEHALALARGTDFAVTDTSRAAMGTKVTLQPLNGGEPVVYTILGAWDTNPEKHIVSYLSQVGKELTGKSVGAVSYTHLDVYKRQGKFHRP